jgi:hypothetical protein
VRWAISAIPLFVIAKPYHMVIIICRKTLDKKTKKITGKYFKTDLSQPPSLILTNKSLTKTKPIKKIEYFYWINPLSLLRE